MGRPSPPAPANPGAAATRSAADASTDRHSLPRVGRADGEEDCGGEGPRLDVLVAGLDRSPLAAALLVELVEPRPHLPQVPLRLELLHVEQHGFRVLLQLLRLGD